MQCSHRDQFSTRCPAHSMRGKPMCYNHMEQTRSRPRRPVNEGDVRRRVLEGGEAKAAVARDVGCSRQRVQAICR